VLKFVVNMNSEKIHRFIVNDDAVRQRTLCCWKFLPSEQPVMYECPSGVMWHDLCDRCLPELRVKLLAQQGGDSDTSDSEGTE